MLDDKDGFESSIKELLEQHLERQRNKVMTLAEATDRACAQPTLVKALEWIAVWECDRAVKQALNLAKNGERTAQGGSHETFFGICFQAVLSKFKEVSRAEAAAGVGRGIPHGLHDQPVERGPREGRQVLGGS